MAQIDYEILFHLDGFWAKSMELEKSVTVAVYRAKWMIKNNPDSYKGIKVVRVTREIIYEEGLR